MQSNKLIPFIIILGLPITLAFDCNIDPEFCDYINSTNLTDEDRDILIGAALYQSTDHPDHDFIEDWNTNIEFATVPNGVPTHNEGPIRDAWLKLITVMPSILEDELLSPGYGNVLSAYNYRIQLPTGTMAGDCDTDYFLDSDEHSLSVYLKDNLIGHSTLESFTSNEDMEFENTLNIQVTVGREHYEWEEYCCDWGEDGCDEWCERCVYDNTDYKTDELMLQDMLSTTYHNPEPQFDFRLIDSYHDTIVGLLNITNHTSYVIYLDDAYLKKTFYTYLIQWEYLPYYVLTLHAIPSNKTELRNLNLDGNTIITLEADSCLLDYSTHFSDFSEICDLTYEPTNLDVKTDKTSYHENETIVVEVFPEDTPIILEYAGETIIAENSATFTAKFPYNKISAFLDYSTREKIIGITKKNRMTFFLNLGIFSSILLVIYELMKKYFGLML